ncbi:hypothetical protein GCM10027456_62460 [Kineosporia babensis]
MQIDREWRAPPEAGYTSYDADRAAQLPEEAGWVDDGSGTRAKDGQKPPSGC